MFILIQLVRGIILQALIFGVTLFLPAGTWHWGRAWALMATFDTGMIITMLTVFPGQEDLLRERMKPLVQKDQPLGDKIVLMAYLALFVGMMVVSALDVFRFHWLPVPPLWLSNLGLLLFALGWTMISLVFRQNPFSAPVVKYQAERHHQVVDTGLYGIVRHPMYAATLPLTLGMTLWLQSYTGALVAIASCVILGIRIRIEEAFLIRHLPGYPDYQKRVRYRMIPGVW